MYDYIICKSMHEMTAVELVLIQLAVNLCYLVRNTPTEQISLTYRLAICFLMDLGSAPRLIELQRSELLLMVQQREPLLRHLLLVQALPDLNERLSFHICGLSLARVPRFRLFHLSLYFSHFRRTIHRDRPHTFRNVVKKYAVLVLLFL